MDNSFYRTKIIQSEVGLKVFLSVLGSMCSGLKGGEKITFIFMCDALWYIVLFFFSTSILFKFYIGSVILCLNINMIHVIILIIICILRWSITNFVQCIWLNYLHVASRFTMWSVCVVMF